MNTSATIRSDRDTLSPAYDSGDMRQEGTFSYPHVTLVVTSVAMAAIAVVAAFFCFKYGLLMLDTSAAYAHVFGGRVLLYMGAVFGTVGALNLAAGVGGGLLVDDASFYTKKICRMHTAGTVLAPILAIPLALCFGIQMLK